MRKHNKTINFTVKQLGNGANYNQREKIVMTQKDYEKRINDLEDYIEELYNIIQARGVAYVKVMAYLKDKGLREDYEERLKVIEER
ncbi:hypothetical protein [Bacillus cereus]|uniref:Uncharacterized protein n=1 Tax=Bacillus cereus TaxID=1396 RepID=A0A9X6VLW4_BACCE|nr:hypothetical protein [Bacillus cereus]PFC15091.1 hypothetical protein CN284_00235 [Bacillus cereus]PFD22664.1 hypothetical protein CN263_09120 [Bacillus cereus]